MKKSKIMKSKTIAINALSNPTLQALSLKKFQNKKIVLVWMGNKITRPKYKK